MQVILITRAGRSFLSLRLVGWRLGIALSVVALVLLVAVRTGIALSTSDGSLTERLTDWWKTSRDDAIARELGGLKAQIDLLESTVSAMDTEADDAKPRASIKPLEAAQPPRMEDLKVRVQKISYALDDISASRQRLLERIAAGAAAKPIDAPISSNYGYRADPFDGGRAFHRGIDFLAPPGTPVYAVGDGVVEFIGPAPGFGKLVEVRHGPRLVSRYAHLQGIEVTSGMPLKAGQRIARVGSTGRSTGPHLHFELLLDDRHVNPAPFLAPLYQTPKVADSGQLLLASTR